MGRPREYKLTRREFTALLRTLRLHIEKTYEPAARPSELLLDNKIRHQQYLTIRAAIRDYLKECRYCGGTGRGERGLPCNQHGCACFLAAIKRAEDMEDPFYDWEDTPPERKYP